MLAHLVRLEALETDSFNALQEALQSYNAQVPDQIAKLLFHLGAGLSEAVHKKRKIY